MGWFFAFGCLVITACESDASLGGAFLGHSSEVRVLGCPCNEEQLGLSRGPFHSP